MSTSDNNYLKQNTWRYLTSQQSRTHQVKGIESRRSNLGDLSQHLSTQVSPGPIISRPLLGKREVWCLGFDEHLLLARPPLGNYMDRKRFPTLMVGS